MKKFVGLLSILFLSQIGFGQYYYLEYDGGTPGDLNQDPAYPSGSGMASGWTTLLGPSVASPTWSANESIPFTFNFNGAAVTEYKVSSTGVLTFTTAAGAAPGLTNAALPDAAVPDNSVCLWGLIADGTNDRVSNKTFGTAPNRQHWIHFSSCTNGSIDWSYYSIVLEETTDNIYLVDQRNTSGTGALSAGIQINGSTAIAVTGSPNVDAIAGTDPESDDDHFYKFIYGTQPANEIELLDVDLDPILAEGLNSVSGTVQNNGSAAISSFDVDWNDGTSHSQTITQTIAPGDTYYFTHPTQMNLTAGTTVNLDVCATVTGDANTGNDCLSSSHLVASQTGTRLPLMEVFTSSTCPPCYTLATTGFGGDGLHDYLINQNANAASGANLAIISHQVDWPGAGDHAWNNDVDERTSYYGVTGAPTVFVDAEDSGAPQDVTDAANVPAFIDIEATHSWNGNSVTVNVVVDPYITKSNLKLHIALLDDHYAAGSSAFEFTNGETDFSHVLRKMLPNAVGQTVSLVEGVQYTDTESYSASVVPADFPAQGSFELHVGSSQEVVVFVQDPNTDEILNAAISIETVGIDEVSNEFNFRLYPNPASESVYVTLDLENSAEVDLTITDIMGNIVYVENQGDLFAGSQQLMIDASSLASGMYFVNLNIDGQVITERLVISK
jgi:hypothetical protein